MRNEADSKPPAPISFGSRRIGPREAVVIIAEIGINHEGDENRCAEMIRDAAGSGADAIKLQTIDPDSNYAKGTESHAIFSRGWLSPDATARMFDLSKELGLEPFTTTGDLETLAWVDALEPAAHKISSGLLTHTPFISAAAATGKPLLMSTGMAEIDDVDIAVRCGREANANGIGVFQCTSLYPAPIETLNLRTVSWLQERYQLPVGFSDHSEGTEAAALSVAAGAQMIEKHFSFDTRRPGFDHGISLTPHDFDIMVRKVRDAEAMLGHAEKNLTETERKKAVLMHRCLVAARDLEMGETLTRENTALKRPLAGQRGVSPKEHATAFGKRAGRAFTADEAIASDDLTN